MEKQTSRRALGIKSNRQIVQVCEKLGQWHSLKAFLGKTNFLKPMISTSYIFKKHEKASKVA